MRKARAGLGRPGAAVFFTLNGEFLGHASCLSNDELGMDWYPSVGLDSHDCVQCNFGFEKPFVFDLLKYCQGAPPPTSSRTMAAAANKKSTGPVTNKKSTRPITNKKSTQKLKTRKRVPS